MRLPKYNRDPSILFSQIDEKIVTMDISRGSYVSLNAVGSYIWSILETPATLEELVLALMGKFDVSQAVCEVESKIFLDKLAKRNMVFVTDE